MLRDNKILYLDGDSNALNIGYGIDAKAARSLIVRQNLVEVIPTPAIKNSGCGAVKYFDNRTPAAALVQGWNQDTSRKYGELETDVEDAFILALLQKR